MGFNRYMVECKFVPVFHYNFCPNVLIDTWWNVNNFSMSSFLCVMEVLIDTWWNVNMVAIIAFSALELVLIDTWWNVNNDSNNFR